MTKKRHLFLLIAFRILGTDHRPIAVTAGPIKHFPTTNMINLTTSNFSLSSLLLASSLYCISSSFLFIVWGASKLSSFLFFILVLVWWPLDCPCGLLPLFSVVIALTWWPLDCPGGLLTVSFVLCRHCSDLGGLQTVLVAS